MTPLTPAQLIVLLAPTILTLGGSIVLLALLVVRRADTQEAHRLHERVRQLEINHATDMAQITAFREEIFYLGRLISILAEQIETAGLTLAPEIAAYLQRRQRAPITSDIEVVAMVHHTLKTYFNLDELRDLTFDVGVDWDNLPGSRLEDKARALALYFDRRGQMELLINAIREIRPNVPLPLGGRSPP